MAKTVSYRQIAKAATLFGGVQVVVVLVGLVKNKAVATLLGAEGLGLYGLLLSTIALINSVANLGLQSSAIRDIAEAESRQESQRVATLACVVQRLVRITGLCAMLFVALAAPILSQWVFGDSSHTHLFVWLSIALLFDQLSMGQLVVLQGLRRLNYLAKANVIGSFLGLAVSLPLYLIWGIDGIVPSIVLSSLLLLLRAAYFARKVGLPTPNITWREAVEQGRGMVELGVVMALAGFIGVGANYLIRIYLTRHSGIEVVGLYNATYTIAEGYVGLVFTAMATDYYPRLAAINKDNAACSALVNEQGEMSLLILLPAVMALITLSTPAVWLLYSRDFLPIVPMLQWALLGVLAKAAVFSFDYIYVAKGDKKVFLLSELLSYGMILVATLVGYYYMDLEGAGMGYMVGYLLSLVQTVWINHALYGITMSRELCTIFVWSMLWAGANLYVMHYVGGVVGYVVSGLLLLLATVYSYRELNKRLDIAQLIKKRMKNKGV